MAKSDEVKAALKAARRASTVRDHERLAEREAVRLREEAAARFNKRSTRNSVAESVEAAALTREEYEAAIERRLVGPVPEPLPRNPDDIAAARDRMGSDALSSRSQSSAMTHGHLLPPEDIAPDFSEIPPEARSRRRLPNPDYIDQDSYEKTPDELREFLAQKERDFRSWSDALEWDPDLWESQRPEIVRDIDEHHLVVVEPELSADEVAWVDREDDRYDELAWSANVDDDYDYDDDDEPASWEIETSNTQGLYEEFQTP